jgi:hypothetical protein
VGCVKEVGELINPPVVSLLDTRVGGRSGEVVVPECVNLKLPVSVIPTFCLVTQFYSGGTERDERRKEEGYEQSTTRTRHARGWCFKQASEHVPRAG